MCLCACDGYLGYLPPPPPPPVVVVVVVVVVVLVVVVVVVVVVELGEVAGEVRWCGGGGGAFRTVDVAVAQGHLGEGVSHQPPHLRRRPARFRAIRTAKPPPNQPLARRPPAAPPARGPRAGP